MNMMMKAETPSPVTASTSFLPVQPAGKQHELNPEKELRHQPKSLSTTPFLVQHKTAIDGPDDKYEQVKELHTGHDFSRITVHSRTLRNSLSTVRHESELRDATGGGVSSGIGGGLVSSLASLLTPVTVDRIDIIDSPTGAIGGYPPVTTGDLNTPGPYNNTTTGGVSNVHQIHFHLDQGDSARVTPTRELQRSAWIAGVEHMNPPDEPVPPGFVGPPAPGGFNGVIVGPDGPAAHEVKRPTTDKIVVADAPGIASLSASHYPFVYRSHFRITLSNGITDIARVQYDVNINKTSATNVPNVENSITPVEKEDLVRGQCLI